MWIFFIFWSSKIHVSPTNVISSLSPPRCHLSSSWHCHDVVLYHTSFLLNQDEIAASALSFSNAVSRRLPSRTETEALNLHHCHRLPSSDRPTPTLYCYKAIISTLATLPTTQPRLYFASSLASAPRHQSSTHHRREAKEDRLVRHRGCHCAEGRWTWDGG
jgi:hypothetical protein